MQPRHSSHYSAIVGMLLLILVDGARAEDLLSEPEEDVTSIVIIILVLPRLDIPLYSLLLLLLSKLNGILIVNIFYSPLHLRCSVTLWLSCTARHTSYRYIWDNKGGWGGREDPMKKQHLASFLSFWHSSSPSPFIPCRVRTYHIVDNVRADWRQKFVLLKHEEEEGKRGV